MNARNLQYIKKFNPKKAIRLADNKIKTKQFLAARGVPVAKTYDVINNKKELYDYDFSSLPEDEFIVKPNKGSRGRGIYRVKLQGHDESESFIPENLDIMSKYFSPVSDFDSQLYTVSGDIISDNTFRRYLVDVLDGKSSMHRGGDSVLIEELLIPGNGFEAFCEEGLADIRVIVFNLIPVAAMLRMPTKASDGKANLDRGGVGFGIDVSTGKITSSYQYGKIHKSQFPEGQEHFKGKKIAYRDDILLYSSKIQYFANLGYLALDRVITDEGPKLLEINARAGLKFQLAAVLPLKHRLDKIKDIHVQSPEKGVEIAKTLFTAEKGQMISKKNILYLSQHATLRGTNTEGDKLKKDIIVDVDLNRKSTFVSPDMHAYIQGLGDTYNLTLHDSHLSFENFPFKKGSKIEGMKIIFGRSISQNYLVKPIKKIFTAKSLIGHAHILEDEVDALHILDEYLFKLSKKLNLSRIMKPTNYLEELDNFITHNGQYNPKFTYKRPSTQRLDKILIEIGQLEQEYFEGTLTFKSPFFKLFRDKIAEIKRKYEYVKAYAEQNYDGIHEANIAMYGELDEALLTESRTMIFEHENPEGVLGPFLKPYEVRAQIMEYLRKRGYDTVKVDYDPNATARLTVARTSKQIRVRIKQNVEFKQRELLATLAHEIDVHIARWIAGSQTGWHILRNGTADFLSDEEGLATYVANKELPEGFIKKGMYYKYFYISLAEKKDFSYIASMFISLRGYPLRSGFQAALRIKKGLENTSYVGVGAASYKEKVYLDGFAKISTWVEGGGDIQQLMLGKIKVKDIDFIL